MIDLEKESLARQTVSLATNPAFVDLLHGLKTDSDRLEHTTLAADPTQSDHQVRVAFLEWQAHRRVLAAIDETIRNAADFITGIEEEREIERLTERERAARNGWNGN